MASRFFLNHRAILSLLLGSVFFIFPNAVFSEETHDAHLEFMMAIIDRYDTTAKEKIGDNEREWIAWGVTHEGIPARALHHAQKQWMHDSIAQSARVYEGVYTYEQGIYDATRGERQRALETLGHLLHLVIDAHPAALPRKASSLRRTSVRTWRDIVEEERTRDTAAILQEGAEMIRRFFAEAGNAEVRRPSTRADLFTPFLSRAFLAIQERLTFARVNIRSDIDRVEQGMRAAFVRAPRTSVGGVFIPEQQVVAHAGELKRDTKKDARTQTAVLPRIPPAPLPLATSIPSVTISSVLRAPVLPDVPSAVIAPVALDSPFLLPKKESATPPSSEEPPPAPPPQELTPPPSTPPPPPPEELDEWGFPLGTVRTYNRAPPETTLTAMPTPLTNTITATFVFSSSKEGALLCVLDGGEEQTCASPVTYQALAEGNHTFGVRARDIWGTYDATPQTHTWTIDMTTPDTILLASPSALMNSASATFTFMSADAGTTFEYVIDGGIWQNAVSPLVLGALADGEHTVTIRAGDAAGNTDATPVGVTWTIDATAPSTPALTSPVTGTNYTTIANTATLVGTRENGAAITINGVSDGITTPTATAWQKNVALSIGANTFTIKAADAAGNTSAPFMLTITRNANQAPSAVSNLAVTTPIITNDRAALTWTTPIDSDMPQQTLTYSLRYATSLITDETAWNAATNVAGLPAVGVSGTAETFLVTGLAPATTYFFVLRTSDGELMSALSNSVTGTTHYGVRITDAHFQGNASAEYMVMKNERGDGQLLQGWKLHDIVATSSHTYTFGAFTLAAGATVTVHTGAGVDTATDLYWNSGISIWNDTGGDTAFLKDSGGTLIDSVSW